MFTPSTKLGIFKSVHKAMWFGQNMALVDLMREDESCMMTFSDEATFEVGYLDLRLSCPCANCKPRRENSQRMIEFKAEVERLRMEKPSVEVVGHYGLKFLWPSGCSSGIFSFDLLREIAEKASLD